MKQKLFTVMLTLVLAFSLSASVLASDEVSQANGCPHLPFCAVE